MHSKLDIMGRSAHYKLATQIVRSVITEWDPYRLIAEGAPVDEFDAQVHRLVARISKIGSGEEAAKAISEIFSGAFEPEHFSKNDCAEVGCTLYARLREGGYIEGDA